MVEMVETEYAKEFSSQYTWKLSSLGSALGKCLLQYVLLQLKCQTWVWATGRMEPIQSVLATLHGNMYGPGLSIQYPAT